MPVPPVPSNHAEALLELIQVLLRELRPEARTSVTLDSSMDRQLGLDSLAMVELLPHSPVLSLPSMMMFWCPERLRLRSPSL